MLTIDNYHNKEIVGLKVIEPLVEETNKYTVEVKFIEGDADGHKTQIVKFEADEQEKLIAFLNFLQLCANKYPHGKGGNDSYASVPGYLYWVFVEWHDDKWYGYEKDDQPSTSCPVLQHLTAKFGDWKDSVVSLKWPKHEGEYWYNFDRAKVFWHDQNGIKHQIIMETT